MPRRHEVPTHLNVEDKLLFGLSARQFTVLLSGGSSAYGLWTSGPDWPDAARAALGGAILLLAAILALVRPHGRGLEEWAFVVLHYALTPKASVWCPCEPDHTTWQPAAADWEEIAPRIAWQEEPR